LTSDMPEEANPSTSGVGAEGSGSNPMQGGALTQELVEKLADKVMALLMEDLKNEAERYRLPSRKLGGRHGISGSAGGW
jgi:hypothetical protein